MYICSTQIQIGEGRKLNFNAHTQARAVEMLKFFCWVGIKI